MEGKPPALVPSYLVAGTRETETPTSQARVPRGPAQDARGQLPRELTAQPPGAGAAGSGEKFAEGAWG